MSILIGSLSPRSRPLRAGVRVFASIGTASLLAVDVAGSDTLRRYRAPSVTHDSAEHIALLTGRRPHAGRRPLGPGRRPRRRRRLPPPPRLRRRQPQRRGRRPVPRPGRAGVAALRFNFRGVERTGGPRGRRRARRRRGRDRPAGDRGRPRRAAVPGRLLVRGRRRRSPSSTSGTPAGSSWHPPLPVLGARPAGRRRRPARCWSWRPSTTSSAAPRRWSPCTAGWPNADGRGGARWPTTSSRAAPARPSHHLD